MRSVVLAVAVWALLWGAAEILGVMPRVELIHGTSEETVARTDAGSSEDDGSEEPPAPGSEAAAEGVSAADAGLAKPREPEPLAFVGPVQAPAEAAPGDVSSPDVDELAGLVCAGGAAPRLHPARLPDGSPALLIDCGAFAELVVPEASGNRASIVARFTYAGPLTKVEAKDLTSDGRPDLAFAFTDRMVLLPTSPQGVWASPTTLEGFTGGPAVEPAEAPSPEARLVLEKETYVVERRGERFVLGVERGGERSALRVERAALVYEADLR